jgi:hypothetical protein
MQHNFNNNMGSWIVEKGHVTSFIPKGFTKEIVNNPECASWEHRFLNDPLRAGGFGNFGYTFPGGRRTIMDKEVELIYEHALGPDELIARLEFPSTFELNVLWRFHPNSVEYQAWIFVDPRRGWWVKEPEFCFGFKNLKSLRFPDKRHVLRFDNDPRRSTIHCGVKHRNFFEAGGLRFRIQDELEELCKDAKKWPSMGRKGCGWRSMGTSWEAPSWGYAKATNVLLKAWEGCVTSTDAPRFFRMPKTTKQYKFNVHISNI